MRRFSYWLVAIGAGALLLRAVNVLVLRPTVAECGSRDGCYQVNGDALYSHLQGVLLADGHGFAASAVYVQFHQIGPGAGDPPLYALFLGLVSALHGAAGLGPRLVALLVLAGAVAGVSWIGRKIGGDAGARHWGAAAGVIAGLVLLASIVPAASGDQVAGSAGVVVDLGEVAAHRLASCVLGAVAVVLIGLLGRRLGGDRVGLVAAGLAALNPMLWINDGMLLSESLYVPLIVVAVLAGYAFWDRPVPARAAWLGAAIAMATLARAEAILLFPLMVVPLAWGASDEWRQRISSAVLAGAVGLLLILPWVGFNLARFEEPTFMTTGTGAVLSAGSCDTAYDGEFVGYYANCYDEYVAEGRAQWPDAVEESEHDLPARTAAQSYIADHLGRLPAVMVFRVGRMFDLYKPLQNTRLNIDVEGRGIWASKAGLSFYWLSLALGVVGLIQLWRRRLPVSPYLAVFGAVLITAATTFGVTRYRAPVDALLMVLAALGLAALVGWPVTSEIRPRREPMSPAPAPDDELVEHATGD